MFSIAARAFALAALASFVSAQMSDPQLRPVGVDHLDEFAPEPEPEPDSPKDCPFYEDCWKLTVLGVT